MSEDQNIQKILNTLRDKIDSAMDDAVKSDKGVKTAGTRLRKVLQEVTADCKTLRKVILDSQKNG